MGLLRFAFLKGAESQWLARNLPRYAFSRRAVRRFMPGESLEDAFSECARLAAGGVGTVITRLGENITAIEEADAVSAHYLDALSDIARRALPTHLSVKLTQLGLDISADRAAAYVDEIAGAAAEMSAPVWIDMESSRYTDVTIDVFRRTRRQRENVGLCLQAYLHRSGSDLTALLASTTAIRLVKGAYMEPAEVAIQHKQQVDENYLACAVQLLTAVRERVVGYVPVFATHDVALINKINEQAKQLRVSREQYEFQMLYGIRTAQQQKLASEGYRLRVLISYGAAWFAWYMRRLAERPANVWFVFRNMLAPGR
jgi:proline dehydrogenase